jgi:hypothetical protein
MLAQPVLAEGGSMVPRVRSVHVVPRSLGDRSVLVVAPEDQRIFDFGERVSIIDADGGERAGVVTWDPVARWVVHLQGDGNPGARPR